MHDLYIKKHSMHSMNTNKTWKCFRCNLSFKSEELAKIHKEITSHNISNYKINDCVVF